MLKEKRIAILISLLVIMLVVAGCGSSKEDTSSPESSTEKNSQIEIEGSIADWVSSDVDELSEEIAGQITEVPIAKNIAATAIKTAMLARLEIQIEHMEPLNGTDKYSVRANFRFPVELDLPIVGEKEYWVSVSYNLILEGREVTESEIILSSFKMTEATDYVLNNSTLRVL